LPAILKESTRMNVSSRVALGSALALIACAVPVQAKDPKNPTWWDKYQYFASGAAAATGRATSSLAVDRTNVDVSNECGPQSETYVTLDSRRPSTLAGGSNEIFRLPMRGYYSSDGGATWGGVDLPLPAAKGNGINFGSDPTLAFDTRGNAFYGYIVVYFGSGNGVNATSMSVARSTDGGRTYPAVTYFSTEGGSNHFNDKPMITADTNAASPYRDRVYIAWDAASGGSQDGGIRVARSADAGATFTVTRADEPSGPGRGIGAVPFVGPGGEVYVAWNDYAANTIAFNRSFDGGATWGQEGVIASKRIPFDIGIPAESFRAALVYPSCEADRSSGPNRGRLYCSWMDLTDAGTTDIVLSFSDDQGAHWSSPAGVGDRLSAPADRFNHWMSVDAVTGAVTVSYYDTRNDRTGARYETDVYLARSADGGNSWRPDVRVTTARSNEHDCGGTFPCSAINYGNQQGDYEGLVSFGGVSHPIWTDSRRQLASAPGCRGGLAMEEVFTATVR
jgi:hypothetical protein